MSEDAPIPSVHFDGRQVPRDVRLATWSRLVPWYDVEPGAGTRAEDGEFDSRAWLLGDMAVTASRVPPLRIRRTPSHILADGRDTYSFVVLKHGGWRGDIEGHEVQVGSGQVAIMDFASTWEVEGTAQDNIMLVVPRARVEALGLDIPPLKGRTLEGAAGRLLAEHMIALVRHLPSMTARELPVVIDATMALVSVALGAMPRDGGVSGPARTPVVARVRALIEEHLTSPDLSVELLCRDGGVTRSTLYRAFADTGGIANYIQRRRLEAAHLRISDEGAKASMTEIADIFCFSSQAHFSTAFRRQFGYTPREARMAHPRPGDTPALFEAWRGVIDESGA